MKSIVYNNQLVKQVNIYLIMKESFHTAKSFILQHIFKSIHIQFTIKDLQMLFLESKRLNIIQAFK